MAGIQVGDKVKWMRLYRGGWEAIHYGTLTEVEIGAEIPCAIVQPKDGTPAQRVECASVLRADDPSQPQPNGWDAMCKRMGFGLHDAPMRVGPLTRRRRVMSETNILVATDRL